MEYPGSLDRSNIQEHNKICILFIPICLELSGAILVPGAWGQLVIDQAVTRTLCHQGGGWPGEGVTWYPMVTGHHHPLATQCTGSTPRCLNSQSEANIQVMWSLLTNQKPCSPLAVWSDVAGDKIPFILRNYYPLRRLPSFFLLSFNIVQSSCI